MKETPIIFTGPMVKAIMDGKKSQTRRVAWKYDNPGWYAPKEQIPDGMLAEPAHSGGRFCYRPSHWQKTKPGDVLWLKETWWMWCEDADDCCPCEEKGLPNPKHHMEYRATHPDKRPGGYDDVTAPEYGIRWKSPIFMPRWASRITLEVTATRIERLQDISEEDAKTEGVMGAAHGNPKEQEFARDYFRAVWTSIYPTDPKSWDANPWVVVLEFKKDAS